MGDRTMVAVPHGDNQKWTVDEYLAFEETSEVRHEFIDSQIYAMTGGSANHDLITNAINYLLYARLLDTNCLIHSAGMRVQVNATRYLYPDVSALCEEPVYTNEKRNSLTNPSVIIEVLSDSTEKYDRGEKFNYYRSIESIQEYILVSQHQMQIEQYVRQANGNWMLKIYTAPDETLMLTPLNVALSLSDIYRQVDFSAADDTGDSSSTDANSDTEDTPPS